MITLGSIHFKPEYILYHYSFSTFIDIQRTFICLFASFVHIIMCIVAISYLISTQFIPFLCKKCCPRYLYSTNFYFKSSTIALFLLHFRFFPPGYDKIFLSNPVFSNTFSVREYRKLLKIPLGMGILVLRLRSVRKR